MSTRLNLPNLLDLLDASSRDVYNALRLFHLEPSMSFQRFSETCRTDVENLWGLVPDGRYRVAHLFL